MLSQITGKLEGRACALCTGQVTHQPVRVIGLVMHLQLGGSLRNAFVSSHLKFSANPWPFLVNHAKHSASVQGRAPAIL